MGIDHRTQSSGDEQWDAGEDEHGLIAGERLRGPVDDRFDDDIECGEQGHAYLDPSEPSELAPQAGGYLAGPRCLVTNDPQGDAGGDHGADGEAADRSPGPGPG